MLYSRKDSVWKLSDFGLTDEGNSNSLRTSRDSKGTNGYRAPELLGPYSFDQSVYNNRVDIWSIGCILFELATGEKAFAGDIATYAFKVSASALPVPLDEGFSETCKETIRSEIAAMLQLDYKSRPSSANLLESFTHHFEAIQPETRSDNQPHPFVDSSKSFVSHSSATLTSTLQGNSL